MITNESNIFSNALMRSIITVFLSLYLIIYEGAMYCYILSQFLDILLNYCNLVRGM